MNNLTNPIAIMRKVLKRPVVVMLFSCQVFFFTVAVASTMGMLAGIDGFRARPPHVTWQFIATFSSIIVVLTTAHFLLLWAVRGQEFWPSGWKAWFKGLSPCWTVLGMSILLVISNPWTPEMLAFAVPIVFGVAIALAPTGLCLSEGMKDIMERQGELIDPHPIDVSDLPPDVSAYFEQHTAELQQIGFQLIGDFRLKRMAPTYSRFFLHSDGDTYASINSARTWLRSIRAVCFISLTETGYYLESGDLRLNRKRKKVANFELQSLPGLTAERLFQRHHARLWELPHGRVRPLSADEVSEVIRLGHKRLYDQLMADGLATKNPYVDFDETNLFPDRQPPAAAPVASGDDMWEAAVQA